MRPVHPLMLARMRRGDSSYRYICEGHGIVNGAFKQSQSDWLAGDGPPSAADFEFVVDGGLRLAPVIANLITSTTGASFFTDLNNDFPYSDALVSWGGTEDPGSEIQRVIANLHPNRDGSGRTVNWWKCQLFNVVRVDVRGSTTPTPQLVLAPVATVTVAATGDAAGDVTFDFSALATKPKLKTTPPAMTPGVFFTLSASFPWYLHPCSIVRITALKADGSAATNVGWGYDNSITTFGTGNVLRGATIDKQFTTGAFTVPAFAGWVADTGSVGVPKLSIQTGAFTAKTITFSSGNLLDLTAAPTGSVYLAGLADTPPGTSVTFRIRNDADSAYVDFTDGQTFADLALTATQTRKCQIVLTPNAAGSLTPIVRRIGMEEKTVVDLSHVAEITNYQCHVDPVTLEARPTTATLRAVKNGINDFRSTIEDLLTTYDIGSLEFRWYCGDTRLNRQYWTLIDCFPYVEDFEPSAASVGIMLMGANALISANVPKYDLSGSGLETPDSTVTNPGSWTDQAGGAVNIHLTIDEAVSDDTDYIKSPNSPAAAAVEFGLSNLADPSRDTGHYVDFRMRKSATGGDVLSLNVELRQGAVVKMASDVLTPVPDEWTDYTLALSPAQAQSISDYTDLRLRFGANVITAIAARNVQISWAQLRVVGQRTALVYNNQAANVVYADLLSQAEVPARYKGQGLKDTTVVSKTITASNAFDEMRYLSANAGFAVISTRGAIHAVDMFSPKAAVAYFPAEKVVFERCVPGFRERRPLTSVLWNWNNEKNRFDDEAVWQNTPALTKLGKGRFDPEPWPEEAGKYIYSGAQAKAIVKRTGQSLGTGLIQWRWRPIDHYPELECGDVVAIGTKRFLVKDPHSTRALRGNLIAAAVLTDCSYDNGVWAFTGWVQSYADILGGPVDSVSLIKPAIRTGAVVFRGDHLFVLWNGDSKVLSVKIATSTTTQPLAGTGTAVDGQDGEYDAGAFTYGQSVRVTITPYGGLSATGVQGEAYFIKYRLPHIETVFDFGTGKPLRSTAWNDLGSFLPFASPSPGAFFSWASGGPATPQMWTSFGWSSANLTLPDGSTVTVPAAPAAPAAPTLSQVAGGALAARTRWAKVAYVKVGASDEAGVIFRTLYPVSANNNFAISINNLLKVTSPADPGGGFYDGWCVLVGSASGSEYVQEIGVGDPLIAFGTDWTEPVGGFSTTANSLWTASWKSITVIRQAVSTTHYYYPHYNISKGLIRFLATLATSSPKFAAIQNGDGVLSLGQYGAAVGYSGVSTFATPAGAGATSGTTGGGRLT